MAVFLLIRHGHNDIIGKKLAGRLPDVHLNDQGMAQASRLADELRKFPIKAIYASPLERAVETAKPIADVHKLPVRILPALLEIDFGQWEGQDINQLKLGHLWNMVQGKPGEFRFPGGEAFAEAQQRVVKGLVSLCHEYSEDDLLVCVSHSDVIRLAVTHFLGMPLDSFQRIRISPASVTILHLQGDQAFFGPINYGFDFSV